MFHTQLNGNWGETFPHNTENPVKVFYFCGFMNYKKPDHFGIGSIEALFVTHNYTIQSFDFRLKKLKSIILVLKNFNAKA